MRAFEGKAQYPLNLDELPRGWGSAFVGEVCSHIQSGFASGEHNAHGNGIPHIRPMNIERDGRLVLDTIKYVDAGVDERRLHRGDVLFNNTNSPVLVGKTTAISSDADLAFSNHMTRLRPATDVDYRFLAHELHFLWMCGYFARRCNNHVNQASVSADTLSATVPVSIAPPGEQRRIVDAVDSYLSRLDAAAATLEAAQTKLKAYRASVLKAAVQGRLVPTEAALARSEKRDFEPADVLLKRILSERRRRWEQAELAKLKAAGKSPKDEKWKAKYEEPSPPNTKDLPDLPEGWCWASFEQLTSLITSGSRGWAEYYAEEGATFIRAQDIKTDALVLEDIAHVTPPEGAEGSRTAVHQFDLLVTITGANVTKTALVEQDVGEAYVSQHVGLCRPVEPAIAPYLHTFVVCPAAGRRYLEKAAYGAGKPGLNLDNLKQMIVALPPRSEAPRIVDTVDQLVGDARHNELIAAQSIRRISRLRQAVLKWAFAGKLVDQDPNDEPAERLLERIRAERAELETPQRTRRAENAR